MNAHEEQVRQTIIAIVQKQPGIRGTELCIHDNIVNDAACGFFKEGVDVVDIMNQMVVDGHLVELEYVLAETNYRIKSMYFPQGTNVQVETIDPNVVEYTLPDGNEGRIKFDPGTKFFKVVEHASR